MKKSITLIVALMVPVAYGWNSFGPYTHEKITDDAVNAISAVDYPDIHRFVEELRDGSETEAHAPPGVGSDTSATSPHMWWPDHHAWWDKDDDPNNKKCALQWYSEYEFHKAYLRIGYFLHLAQDRFVPAHIYRCIHGWGLDNPTDELEDYADTTDGYGYASTSTVWKFIDDENREWYFWLSDAMDDDDGNDLADGLIGGTQDDDGKSKTEWGLGDNVFGTYGYGDDDPLPGNHKGSDKFWQYREAHGVITVNRGQRRFKHAC